MPSNKNITSETKSCPICKSDNIQPLFDLYDDRYAYNGKYILYECADCEHKYLNASLSASELQELYSNYYPRSHFAVENYKPHVESAGFFSWLDGAKCSAFRWIPRNVKVLDIGCGFAETIGYHKARNCEVYGVEADENAQRVADKYGFNIRIGLFNPADFQPDYFDYITLNQVLEHATDPVSMLRGVAELLNKDGKAVLSTPNANGWGASFFGKRWINWHAPYHCHFFSKKSFEIAARKAGLVVEQVTTITSSDWLKFQWIHLVMFPRREAPSLFWTPPANRDFDGKCKKAVFYIAAMFSAFLHLTRLNHLITRFFDSIGCGDNCVVLLRHDQSRVVDNPLDANA